MHQFLCLVGACVAGALAAVGCNGEVGSASTPSESTSAAPPAASAPQVGSPAGPDGGLGSGSSSGGSAGGGEIPIPVTSGAPIVVASSWDGLVAGQYATSFDVLHTDTLFFAANVGSKYNGATLGLNLQSSAGGTLAGYTAIVTGGAAHFNVKLAGTVMGRSAQTGTFPIVLGDMGTQTELGRTAITLVKGGAQ